MSLVSSLLPMQLDVYVQSDVQDLNTGAIKKEWHYQRTISCSSKGFISNSATSRSGDKQNLNTRYTNDQMIEIRSAEQITYREKLTNIRDMNGNVIWKELDYPSDSPTVFEVISSTPITDPFGNVISYNSVAKRSENQQIGL